MQPCLKKQQIITRRQRNITNTLRATTMKLPRNMKPPTMKQLLTTRI